MSGKQEHRKRAKYRRSFEYQHDLWRKDEPPKWRFRKWLRWRRSEPVNNGFWLGHLK